MSSSESFFITLNPSVHFLGYSVWRNQELFKHGIIKANENDANVNLEIMFNQISALMDEYSPSVIAIQTIPMRLKADIVRNNLLLQGMVMAICVSKHIFVKITSLGQWKKDLKIKDKESDLQKVAKKYVTRKYGEILNGIEAEAICIGLGIFKSMSNISDVNHQNGQSTTVK